MSGTGTPIIPDPDPDRPDPVPAGAIWPYFAITFGISWGLFAVFALIPETITRIFGEISGSHPLFILAVYAPAIAALVIVGAHGGAKGLRRFAARLTLWRCGAGWWAFLLLGIPAIYLAGAWLQGGLAGGVIPFGTVGAALSAMAFMLVLGPVEELGWRGIALPLLQRRMVPLAAGLVLGAIWGLWHLPAFWLAGTPQSGWSFLPFLVGAIAVSVIVTPLFNRSGGSILLPALFHFQLNNPLWPDAQPWDMALFVLVAVLVVILHRRAMLTRAGAAARVIA